MRTNILITLILILSGNVFGQTCNKIVFEKRLIDVGVINNDTIVVASFRFKNNSDSTILIKEVTKSCTCSKVTIDNKKIGPGDMGIVKMFIDTKKKNGKFKVYAVMIANTKQKYYKLTVVGEKKGENHDN